MEDREDARETRKTYFYFTHLKHPSLLHPHALLVSFPRRPTLLYLVTHYAVPMDEIIHNLSDEDRFYAERSLLEAAHFMSSWCLTHRNLKPSAILFRACDPHRPGRPHLLISEVGQVASHHNIGDFSSPEHAVCSRANARSNLFSMGLLIFSIYGDLDSRGLRKLLGERPAWRMVATDHGMQQLHRVVREHLWRRNLHESVVDEVTSMLNREPRKRPKPAELMAGWWRRYAAREGNDAGPPVVVTSKPPSTDLRSVVDRLHAACTAPKGIVLGVVAPLCWSIVALAEDRPAVQSAFVRLGVVPSLVALLDWARGHSADQPDPLRLSCTILATLANCGDVALGPTAAPLARLLDHILDSTHISRIRGGPGVEDEQLFFAANEAVYALTVLSTHRDLAAALSEAGVAQALVRLLASPYCCASNITLLLCRAMLNMMRAGPSVRRRLVEAGLVRPLTTHLCRGARLPDRDIIATITGALIFVAQEHGQPDPFEPGVVEEALCTLLRTTLGSLNCLVGKQLLNATLALCEDIPSKCPVFLEAGLATLLVDRLRWSLVWRTEQEPIRVLFRLVAILAARGGDEVLLEAGVCPQLVSAMRNSPVIQNSDTLDGLLGALAAVGARDKPRRGLVQAGMLDALPSILTATHAQSKISTAVGLARLVEALSPDGMAQDRLGQEGAPARLVALCRIHNESCTREEIIEMLRGLRQLGAGSPTNQRLMEQAGLLALLVSQLREPGALVSADVATELCLVLRMLCHGNPTCQAAFLRGQGAAPLLGLVRMCTESSQPQASTLAKAIFMVVAACSENKAVGLLRTPGFREALEGLMSRYRHDPALTSQLTEISELLGTAAHHKM
ncbi:hypothetical protein PAPYR_10416 [Paratrimastix pyriformis]|uniref:Protein kinase domain-containing protein n=1 Tax=Paratrimastix pyriformis TaxID=342808 RepID=A0ABQ8U8P5_9EUKA|nr:hypothetical protein PAPYR_10416 [Paratrimastix pyriformis]